MERDLAAVVRQPLDASHRKDARGPLPMSLNP